ncbi:MAG: hypothetical protein GY797_10925, partial [Deltaproteobacteria bacterium]|nr:hypothetical protein [Deltaproteobacteria bacterium]
MKQLVIDESVSDSMLQRFEGFARKRGIRISEQIDVAKLYSGMPDDQILYHLLNQNTIFLTTDRPFHNKVLSKGLRSVYIDGKRITDRKLPGISIKHDVPLRKDELTIKEDYHPPEPEIRPLLLPSSPKTLKKLRTKRRRIRSHFGGYDHLDQIAITVSWDLHKDLTLIGIRIRISSNVGIKAFDASESYIADTIAPEHRGLASICYALILSIQLILHSVETVIYFDAPKIGHPVEDAPTDSESPYRILFETLSQYFPDLQFIPSMKGKFIERMRLKLKDLARRNSNEIIR